MELSEAFYYDETSPTCLRWKVSIYSGRYKGIVNVLAGDVAGSLGRDGYYTVRLEGTAYKVHRIIAALKGILVEGLFIDHIDRNRTNNVASNLRAVTRSKNNRNHSGRKTNKSGVNGVYYNSKGGYWVACWYEHDTGVRRAKYFSVEKYGHTEAFNMAVECRKRVVAEMNSIGAGYLVE